MARYTDEQCRICRREGQKLFLKGSRCYSDKCSISRRNYAPGQHGQKRSKLSEYGLQLQEKLAEDIAYVVSKVVGTEDVAVFISGKHSCVAMRGIKDRQAVTNSSVLRGKFMDNPHLRAEFLSLIKGD